MRKQIAHFQIFFQNLEGPVDSLAGTSQIMEVPGGRFDVLNNTLGRIGGGSV
jgi:hypothetical protein